MTYSIAYLPGLLPAAKVTELAPLSVLVETVAKARAVLMPEVPYEDSEALAALQRLMDELYPAHAAQMKSCCPQLLERLGGVVDDATDFERAFTGQGPFAQRLRQLAFFERALSPRDALATQALTLFDYTPQKDAAGLARQHTLVAELSARVSAEAERWIPNRYLEPQNNPLQESGFYGVVSGYGVVYLCHLYATLPNGVQIAASAASGRAFSLYARHPEEARWFQSSNTAVLPGSMEALWSEYERCSALLRFFEREGPVTFTGTLKRAWTILEDCAGLPGQWYGFARTEGPQRELGFHCNGAQLYAISRGQSDPERLSRVMKVYDGGAANCLFSVPFSELNAKEQTMLLTQANRVMDDIEIYLQALPAETR